MFFVYVLLPVNVAGVLLANNTVCVQYGSGTAWKELLNVTLSFADGSSARISAINASLRHYRPSFMHYWQLKTFWHQAKICWDDIEWHSFEEICTTPATFPEVQYYSLY